MGYPGTIQNLGSLTVSSAATLAAGSHSTIHNSLATEVTAIETELGVYPSGEYSTVAERLNMLALGITSGSLTVITATSGTIQNLTSTSITVTAGTIQNFTCNNLLVEDTFTLPTGVITSSSITNLTVTSIKIVNQVPVLTAGTVNVTTAAIDNLTAGSASITTLKVTNAVANLTATSLLVTNQIVNLSVGTANITNAEFATHPQAPDTNPSSALQYAPKGYVDLTVNNAKKIVQVVNTITGAVNTGTTAVPLDDTIPQQTEGDEYMTLAITPTKTTNKLLVEVTLVGTNSTSGNTLVAALFQDSTANAIASAAHIIPAANNVVTIRFSHYMAAGTTSETTFKVRAGAASATTTFNGSGGSRLFGGIVPSSITITEIEA